MRFDDVWHETQAVQIASGAPKTSASGYQYLVVHKS